MLPDYSNHQRRSWREEDENQWSAYDIAVIIALTPGFSWSDQIYFKTDSSFSNTQIENPNLMLERHAELPFRRWWPCRLNSGGITFAASLTQKWHPHDHGCPQEWRQLTVIHMHALWLLLLPDELRGTSAVSSIVVQEGSPYGKIRQLSWTGSPRLF